MKNIPIKPLGDRVVIMPLSDEEKGGKTKSGIIIPETVNKERSEEGVIVAVGPGRVGDDNELVPMTVKKGQRVIFSKYSPDEIKIDGKEYLIVSEQQILAVIED